jgi:molybdopterin converting factor small subunit
MANIASEPEITVLYFAAASTAVGSPSERVRLPIPQPGDSFPLSSLGPLLVSRHPSTNLDKVLESSQWSVDMEMVENVEDVRLKGGEEVAIICPVSGG